METKQPDFYQNGKPVFSYHIEEIMELGWDPDGYLFLRTYGIPLPPMIETEKDSLHTWLVENQAEYEEKISV